MPNDSFLNNEVVLPNGWENGIRAFNITPILKGFPEGTIQNIIAVKNKRIEEGKTFTIRDLVWILILMCDKVKEKGYPDQPELTAYIIVYKYLEILIPNTQAQEEIKQFMLSK